MEVVKNKSSFALAYLKMAIIVLFLCLCLFWLDWETHSIMDLFKPGNLLALILYFTPTFIITILLFHLFLKKYSVGKSFTLSLLTGIPASITVVICVLLYLMP